MRFCEAGARRNPRCCRDELLQSEQVARMTDINAPVRHQALRQVIVPIRVGLDPMERLLVASIKGDPEFEAIEPQVFDDAVNGKGMRVLRYRKDRKVDVYWQPGVRVNRGAFTVGAGIDDFAETMIEPAHFQIGDRGVDLHVAFTDAQGRQVELRVHENAPGKRGFPLLAPVGANIDKPTHLFLVYMPDIDLVRRTGSEVEVRIDDRILRPASFPVPLCGHRVWFIRYVGKPVIGTLNAPTNQPVVVELPVPGSIEAGGMTIVADGDGSVTRLGTGPEAARIEVDFAPAFPNLLDLPCRGSAKGRWSIRIAGANITGGSYMASREQDRVAVALHVTECWRPSGLPLSMKIFTRMVPKFRTWPTTYQWRGEVELGPAPTMTGQWERVRRQ
jgi:hypothetical protein